MPQPEAVNLIRPYRPADVDLLIDIFLSAVRETASRNYTAAQIAAWTGQRTDRDQWLARRASRPTWVAEAGGEIAGFTDLEPDGHVDMLFVHPAWQRRGVAGALLRHVEDQARAAGLGRLFTEASITARPVFERHGFRVVAAQDVAIGGQLLRNFRMEKRFASPRGPG